MTTILSRKGGGSGGSAGVSSLEGLTGAVTLSAGDGVTLTPTGQDIEISALGWDDLQPIGTRVQLCPWQGSSANTNFSAQRSAEDIDGVAGALFQSAPAQNNEVTFKVVLAAGEWTMYLTTFTSTDQGIITVSVDAVDEGTIDLYSGVFTARVVKTLAGVTVATDGIHDLRLRMATKNASSSGYDAHLTWITFARTA